ncbi:hypothetical protein HDE76_000515 [Rhodanobacter sp. ANJX3]|nr:hypothetical protein [Rhodanobacter sp. ANJX3]
MLIRSGQTLIAAGNTDTAFTGHGATLRWPVITLTASGVE